MARLKEITYDTTSTIFKHYSDSNLLRWDGGGELVKNLIPFLPLRTEP